MSYVVPPADGRSSWRASECCLAQCNKHSSSSYTKTGRCHALRQQQCHLCRQACRRLRAGAGAAPHLFKQGTQAGHVPGEDGRNGTLAGWRPHGSAEYGQHCMHQRQALSTGRGWHRPLRHSSRKPTIHILPHINMLHVLHQLEPSGGLQGILCSKAWTKQNALLDTAAQDLEGAGSSHLALAPSCTSSWP